MFVLIFINSGHKDTFSSEKYLGHPNDTGRSRGYYESDLNTRAKNFKGKHFLLISSLADIQVPVEHSMNFVLNLVKENVLFKHQVNFLVLKIVKF